MPLRYVAAFSFWLGGMNQSDDPKGVRALFDIARVEKVENFFKKSVKSILTYRNIYVNMAVEGKVDQLDPPQTLVFEKGECIMSATYVIRRVVSKILCLAILVVLTILTPAIKLFSFVVCFCAPALALLLVGLAVFFYFRVGFLPSELYCVIAAIIVVLMKYALEFTSDYLSILKDALKDRVFTPLYVKPPVKYTI